MTDNEATLISEALERMTEAFGITHLRMCVYHPQGNAPIETFHRHLKKTLGELFMVHANVLSFQDALAWTLMSYRAMPHGEHAMSPAYLTHGADLVIQGLEDAIGERLGDKSEARLQILHDIRKGLIQRYQLRRAQELARVPEDELTKVKEGDLVLAQLMLLQTTINAAKTKT